ncbi:MalY/PatB family protein [Citrobacter koseri]|uniref:MalY/PatB family protein n=1 Tax=Citrobacter koseri TaxID=545 RepID=UPI0023AE9A58|nr:MalY/PatB family protein [Citrobacter koseri]
MNGFSDSPVDRHGTNSYKWDSVDQQNILPFWVADMDFRVAPAIQNAIYKQCIHGVFGYSFVPDDYFLATVNWLGRRYGFTIQKDWVIYTTGVLPAISAILKAITIPGDGVIVQPPVYNHFFSCIKNQACRLISNELRYVNGCYDMDYDDLEHKASDPSNKVLLLCNPHNPVGRSWSEEALTRVGEICHKNDVLVISDEIHCDLVHHERKHTPFASISQEFSLNSVTCLSPSKGFNIAGLQVANIICENKGLRERINRAVNIHEVCDVNCFAAEALIAAYNESETWLEQAKAYIYANYLLLVDVLSREAPHISALPLEATYLAWLDCSVLGVKSDDLVKKIFEKTGVLLSSGSLFGSAGEGFVRINLACPRSQLEQGLKKISDFFISSVPES